VTCPGRLVPIDDTELWVVERGDPAAFPLLLLHGGPGLDHHEFGDYLDPLTDRGVRLVLVDLRSNGRSPVTPEATWTLERQALDVVMLARAMRLGRYAVLGHSYGAFVALQAAVDYPGMAAATIVSGGIASMRFLAAVAANLAAFEPVELREQVTRSWEREPTVRTPGDVAELITDQLPFHFADPLDPRIEAYAAATADTVYAPDVLRLSSAAGYGGIEVEDRLSEVTGPVLVLTGRHDRTCVVEAAEAIAAGIADARLEIFEASGHMTFVEEPGRYLDEVSGFLDEVRGSGGTSA
jgi:proline iminopeptidase